jgi:ribosomal-protein-alanine N-acetyltransferase
MSAVLGESDVSESNAAFRVMLEDDLDDVIAIEESVYPFPWTRGIFHDCLNIGYRCRVLERNKKIIAYSVMSIAAGESHLLTIVVAKEEQGKGYGKKILNEMIQQAVIHCVNTMYLEVRTSNTTAIQLYEQRGFNELGIRSKYYPAEKGREDALILALDLSF